MDGTELKNSPLNNYLKSLGYELQENGDENIIAKYDEVEKEFDRICRGVGLRNLSHLGILELRGKDVLDFLHRITTNALKDISKEQIKNTVFTTEKGRVIDTAAIMNFSDYQLLICSNFYKKKVLSWINKYVIADDVKVNDTENKYVLLELLGPQADSFITLVCGNITNDLEVNSFKVVSSEGMMFFTAKFIDERNEKKYWILADQENGMRFVKYLNENKGPFDFGFVGEEAYNLYRIEMGIPKAPNEISDQYNPHELNLRELISFTKGCYIGQEVIARLDTYDKVQKKLKGVIFEEPVENDEQFQLFDENGKDAGIITSIALSLKLKKNIGLALVRKAYEEEGTKLIAKNENGKSVTVITQNTPFKK